MNLPVRRRASAEPDRPVRRASAGLSAARITAAVAMLAVSGALYVVTATDDFRLDPARIAVDGAVYTPRTVVDGALAVADGARPNLFRIRTSDLASALRQLPAVLDADVRVVLPDRLVVRIIERAPILVWQIGEARYLVDVDGVLFARIADDAAAAVEVPAGIPTVADRRERSGLPLLGERLDPIDLAAVRQLGTLTPATIGSAAGTLRVSLDDVEGFTIDAQPDMWHAVFGFYTAHLRPTDIIPGQVQCLGALLGTSESTIGTVHLSPREDRCGTFRTRTGSPAPQPSPSRDAGAPSGSPSAAPRGSRAPRPSAAPNPSRAP